MIEISGEYNSTSPGLWGHSLANALAGSAAILTAMQCSGNGKTALYVLGALAFLLAGAFTLNTDVPDTLHPPPEAGKNKDMDIPGPIRD